MHESIYDQFVEECVKVVKVRLLSLVGMGRVDRWIAQTYVLGDPRLEETTLGPVVSLRSAAAIRSHIAEAGASLLLLSVSSTSC